MHDHNNKAYLSLFSMRLKNMVTYESTHGLQKMIEDLLQGDLLSSM